MRRKSPFLSAATILSLLLAAATTLLWASTVYFSLAARPPGWAEPYVAWRTGPTRARAVSANRVGLSFENRNLPWPPSRWPAGSIYSPDPGHVLEAPDPGMGRVSMSRLPDFSLLGFGWGRWSAIVGDGWRTGPVNGSYLSIPFWPLLLLFMLLPVLWAVGAARQRRNRRIGLCPSCGYDLTGNVSGVCPECGAPSPDPQRTAGHGGGTGVVGPP